MLSAWSAARLAEMGIAAALAAPPLSSQVARSAALAGSATTILALSATRAAWDGSTAADAGLTLGLMNSPPSAQARARVEVPMEVYGPMLDAFQAGAFAHALYERELILLAAPRLWLRAGRLHRADGPAIEWPRTHVYVWNGIRVPEVAFTQPQTLTERNVSRMPDARVRLALREIRAHRAAATTSGMIGAAVGLNEFS
jgi:hypothetical protein